MTIRFTDVVVAAPGNVGSSLGSAVDHDVETLVRGHPLLGRLLGHAKALESFRLVMGECTSCPHRRLRYRRSAKDQRMQCDRREFCLPAPFSSRRLVLRWIAMSIMPAALLGCDRARMSNEQPTPGVYIY